MCQYLLEQRSKFEFSLYVECEHFFGSILESASASYCLNCPMTLHLNFAVLFPASNILRHVVEFNFFFQKLIHLALNWVFFPVLDKGSTKVDRRHCIEVFVWSTETTHNTEIWIK